MRVLHLIDGLGTGGAERSLAQLLPLLKKEDVDSSVRYLHERTEGVADLIRSEVSDVKALPGGRLVQKYLSLRNELRARAPDLVHSTLFASNVTARLANRGRIPLLNSLVSILYEGPRTRAPGIHPIKLGSVRLLDASTARKWVSHFHANSESVKRASIRALGIREEQITVIPRGRDPALLIHRNPDTRSEVCAELGLDPHRPIVLCAGRHEYAKGHNFLLSAIRLLHDSGHDCQAVMGGRDGATTDLLHREVERLRLQGSIHFLGHRNDINRLMAGADVLALPSLWEGLPGVVIEAMGSNLPVVAFDLESVRETVEHDVSAFLVPPESAEALAHGIGHLLEDPETADRLARHAQETFKQRFTSELVAQQMVALYRRVAAMG